MQTKALLTELFHASLQGIDAKKLVAEHCQLEGHILSIQGDSYNLSEYEHIYILGSGKAAGSMAKALETLMGEFIDSGLVVSVVCEEGLEKVECMISDHPIPTERSLKGARSLIETMKQCHSNDLYIYVLSGGSSALIEQPVEGISLNDFQRTTDLMLKSALKIDEINAVRKHLSAIKGGRLGAYSDAKGVVLTISDVIGDDLYSIGSAPLYADKTTYKDVVQILQNYNIFEKIPSPVKKVLNEGIDYKRVETPKKPADRIKHYLIGTNKMAREAAYNRAIELGLKVKVIEKDINSEVHLASEEMLKIALASDEKVLIFGGETTVKVEGQGKGGRNQHCVLNMLKLSKSKSEKIAFISAGTDGIDGNSDAAGAYIDRNSVQEAELKDLDIEAYLKENDSYHFFKEIDGLIMTGPTGTNVMDIAILIKE